MANVYYFLDDNTFTAYLTNENKQDYTLGSSGTSFSTYTCVIELYNNKFILPDNCYMFFNWAENETFNDTDKWDTSNVTDMSYMFSECMHLGSLNCSTGDVSKVTNMSCMFYADFDLTTLNASGGNTSKVTDMSNMFFGTDLSSSLDVYGGDTSKVKTMSGMFQGSSIRSLDISTGSTESLVQSYSPLENMFNGCASLGTIYASFRGVANNFVGTYSNNMFNDCDSLIGGADTGFDYGNPTDSTYARIDNPPTAPGYFTFKSNNEGLPFEPWIKENGTGTRCEVYL